MPLVSVLHHHIGIEGPAERGLGVTTGRAAYEAQIDRLVRDYDPIGLDTLLSGVLPRRPLLLTFDDAFASVAEVAREVLAPRRLPAVFFVNPGLLADPEGGAAAPLPLDSAIAWAAASAGMAALLQHLGLPPRRGPGEVIARDMSRCGAAERARIRDGLVAAFGAPPAGARARPLRMDELAALPSLGVEIGNHTMTHTHGRALSAAGIEAEVVAAQARLEGITGRPVRSFSLPYGDERDLTPPLLRRLRETGHAAIFLVHARSNARRPAPDIWYRTSFRDETAGAVRLRLLPALRSLRRTIGA